MNSDALRRRAGIAGLMSLAVVLAGSSAFADAGGGEEPGNPMPDISISNEATAEFETIYHWALDKTGELVDVVEEADAASAELRYAVTAEPTGRTYANVTITGEITITRGDDGISGPISVTFADESLTLPGDPDATCRYTAPNAQESDLPVVTSAHEGQDAVVTYTCEVDGEVGSGVWAHNITGTWNPPAGSEATATANISSYSDVEGEVTVLDDQADSGGDPVELGLAHWNTGGMPTEFDYTLTKDGLELGTCTDITNTAWIEDTDTSATATVTVCPEAGDEGEEPEDPSEPPVVEPLIGSIGEISREVCEVTIPTEVSSGGEFSLQVWDDGAKIDEFSWTMDEAGSHDVTWRITRPALVAAPGVAFVLVGADGKSLDEIDPWEYPAEVAQQCYEVTQPAPTPEAAAPSGPSAGALPDTGVNSATTLAGAGVLAALGAALILVRRGLSASRA